MTEQHPLTDEIIGKIAFGALWSGDLGCTTYTEDDLRCAADWQLEQVIEWLKEEIHGDFNHDPYLLLDLKEAMRPQEEI